MNRIHSLIGLESDLDDVARRIQEAARGFGAPVVGALHLTCADESEVECVEAFQRSVTEPLLPALKSGQRRCFRLANLGARYEWGAVGIAEDHFSTEAARAAFKVIVVKNNGHVAVDGAGETMRFGRMKRYGSDSSFCGALHHLLDDGTLPCADDLREIFGFEGQDRIATLRDPDLVPQAERSLYAAVVGARMQARLAVADLCDRAPHTPTIFIVVPCVTLNRPRKDTEIVCGAYLVDWRNQAAVAEYRGLGDDPSAYHLERTARGLALTQDGSETIQPARNHRREVLENWRRRQPDETGVEERVAAVLAGDPSVTADAEDDPGVVFQRCLAALGRHDPVPAALLLFGRGLVGIHHLLRADRLAHGLAGERAARRILGEAHSTGARFDRDRAREAIEAVTG